ncbi:hypothetical protein F6455_00615 [Proteobacteria bacterium 005FR1]|nr:hypothetical protein [Proteobacteria bacterium 005FR1]
MANRAIKSLAVLIAAAACSTTAVAQQCAAPVSAAPGAPASAIVHDSFQGGINQSPTASGFQWHKGTRTGTVSQGYSDAGALQFRFPAGNNGMSEQRFSLGGAYPELWFRYWVKVPANWEHGSGNTNNKFFAIWMDEYERKGATGVIQTRDSGGHSVISPYVRTRGNQHLGEETGNMLIDISKDRGRWMQVVIHVKMASAAGSPDGVFELYRRWEGEQNFETIFSKSDWDNFHVGGNKGFSHGYLMGWANATQPSASEWLIDDFLVSEKNLLNTDSVPAPKPQSSNKTAKIPKIVPPQA